MLEYGSDKTRIHSGISYTVSVYKAGCLAFSVSWSYCFCSCFCNFLTWLGVLAMKACFEHTKQLRGAPALMKDRRTPFRFLWRNFLVNSLIGWIWELMYFSIWCNRWVNRIMSMSFYVFRSMSVYSGSLFWFLDAILLARFLVMHLYFYIKII